MHRGSGSHYQGVATLTVIPTNDTCLSVASSTAPEGTTVNSSRQPILPVSATTGGALLGEVSLSSDDDNKHGGGGGGDSGGDSGGSGECLTVEEELSAIERNLTLQSHRASIIAAVARGMRWQADMAGTAFYDWLTYVDMCGRGRVGAWADAEAEATPPEGSRAEAADDLETFGVDSTRRLVVLATTVAHAQLQRRRKAGSWARWKEIVGLP